MMDKDFNILYEKLFDQKFEDRLYIGVEDLKLWQRRDGWVEFLGTGYHANNKIGIVRGRYGLIGKTAGAKSFPFITAHLYARPIL